MSARMRPELSEKNKYRLNKHRHYELKHFCLQYPLWKQLYSEFDDPSYPLSMIEWAPTSNLSGDPTAKRALMKAYYSERIELIDRVARDVDPYLWDYIVKGVTESLSYTYLKTKLGIPCSRDVYYKLYRRFFWLLDKARE